MVIGLGQFLWEAFIILLGSGGGCYELGYSNLGAFGYRVR